MAGRIEHFKTNVLLKDIIGQGLVNNDNLAILELVKNSIDAKAHSGSKVASSWTIRTGDGSVDISLPADLQANIDASTNDGHISLGIPVTVEGNFSKSQVHGKMNGGGQPLSIHTGDGSIRLNKS